MYVLPSTRKTRSFSLTYFRRAAKKTVGIGWMWTSGASWT